MVIRRFAALILLMMLVSCGARDQKHFPVLLKGQMTTGMPYKTDDGLISSLKRQDLVLDSDHDGISDKDDSDIDNDGVPNDCDVAPFDKKNGTGDSDDDGLPDFCDLNLQVQDSVFKTFGIMLNLNESDGKNFDSLLLEIALAHVTTLQPLPSTNLVTLTITDGLPIGEYGVYDFDWKNIRLKVDGTSHEEFPEITNSSWSMVHELFHFVATNQKLYQEFHRRYSDLERNNLLVYPTTYSRYSEEEYFAEEQTLDFFKPLLFPQKLILYLSR